VLYRGAITAMIYAPPTHHDDDDSGDCEVRSAAEDTRNDGREVVRLCIRR